jgi:DNA-binding transcriptional LysR family regulator
MEAQALAVERSASGRDRGVRGKVHVSASEWVIERVLGPLVGPLLEKHPSLELELSADARHVNLIRREADIAIRPSQFSHLEVVQRQVGTLAFGLYASDAYLAQHGHPDFAANVHSHRLVAMSESLSKVPELEWLPKFAEGLRVVARCNGRLAMATLAARDVGMAVLPRYIGDATPRLRLLSTPVPGPVRRLWLGYHRDARRIPRVKGSVAFLANALQRLEPALYPKDATSEVHQPT